MKSKIICLILSLVFVGGVFAVNGTYAWFANYGGGIGEGVIHNFKSGSISYSLVGGFVDSTSITPEQNLLKELGSLPENLDDDTKLYLVADALEPDLPQGEEKTQEYVDTQLRMKVYYTNIDAAGNKTDGNSAVGQADGNSPFVAQLATDAEGNAYWRYDDATGYFYYLDPSGSDTIAGGFEATDPVPLFSAMYYSGENTDLPTSVFGGENNEFTVVIAFQAKQAEFAQWSDIGEISYNSLVAEETATTQAQS